MNRKSFLKTIGAGAALGILNPGFVFADDKKGTNARRISTLPTIEADVIVVGAGPSGIPAAVAAARQGAKVVLLEQDFTPGGAPVNMFVSMLCGGPRLGIYREVAQKLNATCTITGTAKADFGQDGANGKNHWYLPSSFMITYNNLISNEKNILFMSGAPVSQVILEEKGKRNTIKGVRINRMEMFQDIKAKVVIDATGTGLIGELCGAPVMYGRDGQNTFGENIGVIEPDNKVQRCTWMYISQRLNPDAVMPLKKLKQKGMVEDDLDNWIREEHLGRKAGIYLHWGSAVECADTRDLVAIGEAQRKCLETLIPDAKTLLDAGFQMHLAPKMGIREVRRIKGEYVLTTTDMQQGNYPEDTIAYTSYGLDAWGENFTKEQRHTKPHGIPYRCLLPLDVEGLLIIGKSISGTHLAASGYRVQPIVASIGQAAGTAAAMAVMNNTSVRKIDIAKLQQSLKEQGVLDKKTE